MEWFGLEQTFKCSLFQPPCTEQGHLQLDRVEPGQPLPMFHYRQCTILISSLDFSSFGLKSPPFVLSQQTQLKYLADRPPLSIGRLLQGLPKAFSSPG